MKRHATSSINIYDSHNSSRMLTSLLKRISFFACFFVSSVSNSGYRPNETYSIIVNMNNNKNQA